MRIAFVHNLQQTDTDEAEAEFDSPATVAMLASSLRRLAHEVMLLEASTPLGPFIEALRNFDPGLILNTAEGTRGRFREAFHPALFDELGLAFIGSDAYVCAITLDKHLTKTIVAEAGVPTPRGTLVRNLGQLRGKPFHYPVIVKPNFEGSSKGITQRSVVANRKELVLRVGEVLSQYPDGVLIEEFIAGIDVVVPFIEGISPETAGVLEPASYVYDPVFASRSHHIYDTTMKQSGFDGLQVVCPAEVPAATRQQIIELSQRAYEALGVRDFGRIDFRVDAQGQPYFLEVNALPSLEAGASIYTSGKSIGITGVDAVLEAVIASAANRYDILRSVATSSVA